MLLLLGGVSESTSDRLLVRSKTEMTGGEDPWLEASVIRLVS